MAMMWPWMKSSFTLLLYVVFVLVLTFDFFCFIFFFCTDCCVSNPKWKQLAIFGSSVDLDSAAATGRTDSCMNGWMDGWIAHR